MPKPAPEGYHYEYTVVGGRKIPMLVPDRSGRARDQAAAQVRRASGAQTSQAEYEQMMREYMRGSRSVRRTDQRADVSQGEQRALAEGRADRLQLDKRRDAEEAAAALEDRRAYEDYRDRQEAAAALEDRREYERWLEERRARESRAGGPGDDPRGRR